MAEVSSYWDSYTLGKYPPRIAPATRVDPDTILAYMVQPNGETIAIKAGFLNTGGIPFANGAWSAYSNITLTSTPQGYAFASIVSVWAKRCVEIRAKSCSRMDFYVRSRRTKNRLPNHPLAVALRRSTINIIRRYEWSQMIWGETFLVPLINEYDYYSDLRWLNNVGMSVDTTLGKYHNFSYFPILGGAPEIFTPQQIAFFKTDNPFDDLRGLSPFETVLLDVGTDRDMARTQKAFYSNDTRIGMMLIPENDMLPAQAQEFMDYWKRNFQGANNAGKPVMMPKNIKSVERMQREPVQDDVILSADVRRRICAEFGVPLSIAGAWDDAQYQSAPEQRKSLYEETIIPECEDMARDMSRKLLPFFDPSGNCEVDFDATKIMATMEDQQGKISIANSRLSSGGIMLNEYRAELEYAPDPNGNIYYVPNGVTIVRQEDIGKPKPAAPAPMPPPTTPPQNAPVSASPPISAPTPAEGTTPAVSAPPIPKIRTKQENEDDELSAWAKKVKNNGAVNAAAFNVDYLNGDVALYVRSTLLSNPDRDSVRQLFQEARDMLAIKDYGTTRAGYKGAMFDLIRQAQQDLVARRNWAANVRTINRRFGLLTAQDALEDAGQNVESFSRDELAAFRAWEGETSGYITGFGEELFKEGGISPEEVANRAEMWSRMSMDNLYNRMRALALPAQRVVYRLGATEQHCPDCAFLNGKVAARQSWHDSGWEPHSGVPNRHACQQFNCDCRLEDTQDAVNFDPFGYVTQG